LNKLIFAIAIFLEGEDAFGLRKSESRAAELCSSWIPSQRLTQSCHYRKVSIAVTNGGRFRNTLPAYDISQSRHCIWVWQYHI